MPLRGVMVCPFSYLLLSIMYDALGSLSVAEDDLWRY